MSEDALAGDREQALEYLRGAFAGDSKLREHAARDGDLDAIRDVISGSEDATGG